MSLESRPPDQSPREEHTVLIFIAVAAVILGALLLIAHFVSAAEDESVSQSPASTPSATLAKPEQPRGQGGQAAAQGRALVAPAALQPVTIPGAAPPPQVSAASFALIERSCGALLYSRNEHQRLPPASLAKIVTALVVEKQRTPLDDVVDVAVSAKQMVKRGSSVMGLEPDMQVSVIDLLYGLFLPSGNDAALTLAQHVGGDVERFVGLMNDEAARLQLRDTHFTNPHGLDDPDLYSSAFDMAIAGRALLDDPLLAQVSSTRDYVPSWPGPALKNGNKLLQSYAGAFGVKIGFTTNAHQTIVAAAGRDGRELIVSVFGSEDRYADSAALFDWAFANVPSRCTNP